MGIVVGGLMGLSLGFRVGTKRTVLIFKQHFPSSAQLNALVSALLKTHRDLLEKKP